MLKHSVAARELLLLLVQLKVSVAVALVRLDNGSTVPKTRSLMDGVQLICACTEVLPSTEKTAPSSQIVHATNGRDEIFTAQTL